MLADLDGDGVPEVIVATDCGSGIVNCDPGEGQAGLFVLPSRGSGDIQPLWSYAYRFKMDSAEPVIVDVAGFGKVILAGTWGGTLIALWDGGARSSELKLTSLDPAIDQNVMPVIRTSPLAYSDASGTHVVFGWLPTDQNAWDARLTQVDVTFNTGALVLRQAWTINRYDSWKSSPALVARSGQSPLIAFGYGLGIGPPPSQSGPVGSCQKGQVNGGVAAVDTSGNEAWNQTFDGEEGNLRASAAIADMNGDGTPDVIIPSGCWGALHAFDGLSGEVEWNLQLGPRSQGSPSIADLDGDGSLEIVLSSYDGQVWVLGQ